MSSSIAKVISVFPYPIRDVLKPYGQESIEAKPADGLYSEHTFKDFTGAKDFGWGRVEHEHFPAYEAAHDFAVTNYDFGLFVIVSGEPDGRASTQGKFHEMWAGEPVYWSTSTPTQAMLDKATARLKTTMTRWLAEGDSAWARTGDMKSVSELSKRAAKYLNVEREWAVDMSEMLVCEGCNAPVSPKAVKCKCGAIRDLDRAAKMGLVTPEQYAFAKQFARPTVSEAPTEPLPVKRGPGRPKKIEASL